MDHDHKRFSERGRSMGISEDMVQSSNQISKSSAPTCEFAQKAKEIQDAKHEVK